MLDSTSVQWWETEDMKPIDKRIDEDIKEGKVPDPIEDLPSEYSKEDRDLEGREPDLGELDEDPSEL
jgi:hypothetical protein